jgi:hypothetical protein
MHTPWDPLHCARGLDFRVGQCSTSCPENGSFWRKAAVHTQTASRSAYQFGIRLGEGALSRSQWEAATSMPWWRVRTSGVLRSRFYPAEKAAVASVTNVT